MSAREELLELARLTGATIVDAGGRTVIVLAEKDPGDELLRIDLAAEIAATQKRVILDAIRAGDLVGYGRERDRAVRRRDLDDWVERRRVRVAEGPDDDRLEQRMARLERQKRKGAA